MKNRIKIILIILTFSISIVNGQIIGNYKSADFNFFERGILYIFGSGHYIGGNELTLNTDSTFIFTTCSSIQTGKWYCKADSLYLDSKTIRWKKDSIQELADKGKMHQLRNRILTFKIDNKGFSRDVPLRHNGKKIISIDKLEKIN